MKTIKKPRRKTWSFCVIVESPRDDTHEEELVERLYEEAPDTTFSYVCGICEVWFDRLDYTFAKAKASALKSVKKAGFVVKEVKTLEEC